MSGNPLLSEIETLCSHPEAQMRIHGLLKMESFRDELDVLEVDRVLQRSLQDMDRTVVDQAKRIHGQIKSQKGSRFGTEGQWPLFRTLQAGQIDRFPKLRTQNLEMLRGAAYELLTPIVLNLHSKAIKGGQLPQDRIVEVLGRLQLPQSLPVLAHIGKDPFLAESVVTALSQSYLPEAEEQLLVLASDTNGPASVRALESLGRHPHPESLAYLGHEIRDSDARRRRAAASALGHCRDPKAGEALLMTLTDSVEDVIVAGVQSLGRLREDRSVDLLIKLGQGTESVRVRAAIAATMGRIQNPSTYSYLELLMEDKDPRVRANAIESLSHHPLQNEQALRILVPGLRSEVPRIRGNSVLGLYKYRARQALDSLQMMFRSPDRMMRRAAAWCSSQIQHPDSANWLTMLVRTEQNAEVLKSGMTALQRFSRQEALDVFMNMVEHPKPEVRITAMQLLGTIGAQPQLRTLTQLYRKEAAAKVRAAIVTAMAHCGGFQALSLLPAYLTDQDDRVVANVVEGYQTIGNIEAMTHLRPMLTHRSRRVRANAIVCLFSLGDLTVIPELGRMIESKDKRDQMSGLWALGATGNELRLGALEEHSLLVLALRDYHRKVLDSSSVTGARLRDAVLELNLTPPPVPSLPDEVTPPETDEIHTGSKAAGSAVGTPPQDSSGAHSAISADRPVDELSVIVQRPERLRQGGLDPEIQEGQGLVWEKLLELNSADPAGSIEALLHHAQDNTEDEVSLLIFLRALAELESPRLGEFLENAVERASSYVSLLYFLARGLKQAGDVALSTRVYVQIFRAQFQALDQLAELAQEAQETEGEFMSAGLKVLATCNGLTTDLESRLGNFYLTEARYTEAFHFLYRARVADPADSAVALRLAYISRKRGHFRLGKVIIKSLLTQLDDENPDYQRAVRLLQDLRKKQAQLQDQEEQVPKTDPE